MRYRISITFLISLFAFIACSKKPGPLAGSNPVTFPSTVYDSIGSFDNLGGPKDTVSPDPISTSLTSFIGSNLPEGQNLTKNHPELFSSTASADLHILNNTQVFITFVSEGAGSKNTLGFYTYPTGNPPLKPTEITKITYFIGNAQYLYAGGSLHPGEKINIGSFSAGTSIGFALLKDAWDPSTHKINSSAVHFLSTDALNPENDPAFKRHVVLFVNEGKTLISFEDTDRAIGGSDNDCNDVVIYATQEP